MKSCVELGFVISLTKPDMYGVLQGVESTCYRYSVLSKGNIASWQPVHV